jgi:hypothetical protein
VSYLASGVYVGMYIGVVCRISFPCDEDASKYILHCLPDAKKRGTASLIPMRGDNFFETKKVLQVHLVILFVTTST